MKPMTRSMAGALALSALLAACGGDAAPSASPTVVNTRPTSTGTLTVLEPAFGSTVQGPTVRVRVRVDGARVLPKNLGSRHLSPDTGHIHINLDERVVTQTGGREYEIPDVQPGDRVLRVEFAAADHFSFNPPVIQIVRFTVT